MAVYRKAFRSSPLLEGFAGLHFVFHNTFISYKCPLRNCKSFPSTGQLRHTKIQQRRWRTTYADQHLLHRPMPELRGPTTTTLSSCQPTPQDIFSRTTRATLKSLRKPILTLTNQYQDSQTLKHPQASMRPMSKLATSFQTSHKGCISIDIPRSSISVVS